MKNLFLICSLALLIFTISCRKSSQSNQDFKTLNTEINNTEKALALASSYNDTVEMYFDTAKIRKNNPNCIKYDKLYHNSDSMFTSHYNMFGDEMYKDGIMMRGYTPDSMMGGGTMGGGMMNTDSMDMHQIRNDTAEMNRLYNGMQQVRAKHQKFDLGIY